jgi:succinoglycan biosynthesis transport protein ExoP
VSNGRLDKRTARRRLRAPEVRLASELPTERRGDELESPLIGYLHTLARRKWLVLQAAILVPAAALALSIQQESRYAASASVLLADTAPLTGDAAAARPGDRVAQTEADLARVPAVAAGTLQRVRGTGLTTAEFLERSSVATRINSDMLDFRVVDSSPERARALATGYARQFTAYRARLQAEALERAQRRLGALRAESSRTATAAVQRRIEDLLVRGALTGSESLLVRSATTADQVQPRPVRAGILGALVGLVLGIALAFLWDALDTRIRRVEDVGERLGLPLLGRLREPSRRLRSKGALVMQLEPHGSEAEAFRILRANLEFANVDEAAEVVLVTGAVDGDGRTTTVSNLAVAFALAGRHVVLVDLNLRNPLVDKLFQLEGSPGLTDVALGHVDLDDALLTVPTRLGEQDDTVSNGVESPGELEILPSGPAPLDSAEFVGSRAVADVIANLRRRADLVLVDAPPLLPVGDARILSRLVDALVVVVNLELVRRPTLTELRRILDACPTRALGFVATGVDALGRDVYSGYYERRSDRARRDEVAA